MSTLATQPVFEVTEEDKRQYHEQGFFITPVLFEPEFIEKVSDEFDRLWIEESKRTNGVLDANDSGNGGDPFMIHLAKRNAVIAGIFQHPSFQALTRAMLGPDADLNYDQIVMKQPRTDEENENAPKYNFAFHQDSYYALSGDDDSGWSREVYLDDAQTFQGWMAFTETTLENGTLFVVPGAHKFGLLQHTGFDESESGYGFDAAKDARLDVSQKIPVFLKPGQLLVFSGLLPHGSGENLSDKARKIIQFSISRVGGRPPEYAIPILRDGLAPSA